MLIWLPVRRRPRLSDFSKGELFTELESAVAQAVETRPRGMSPWICCDNKFVLSPDDIAEADAQFKAGS